MAWETFRSNDGVYLIDWAGLTRIIRSCKRAGAMNANSKPKVERGERDIWALGLRLPDLHSVEVDWNKVALETTTQTENELRRFYVAAKNSMKRELASLIQMMAKAEDDRDNFQDKQSDAQQMTMDNIDTAVKTGEAWVKGLTIVRDTSAEIVMVGATYVSGGTAAPLLTGLGAGMKGGFVYQDTGKVDKALATFSTNLLMGVADLKVGAAVEGMSTSGKIGIAIVWAKGKSVLEVPKGMIEGKSLNQAVAGGGVKLVASTPASATVEGLKAVLGEKGEAWAIPVEVALNILQDKTGEAVSESGEKEKPETKGPRAHLPHPHPNHRMLDAIVYDASTIEKTAVQQIAS